MIANFLYRILFSGSGAVDNDGLATISKIKANEGCDSVIESSFAASSNIQKWIYIGSEIKESIFCTSPIDIIYDTKSEINNVDVSRISGISNYGYSGISGVSIDEYISSKIDASSISCISAVREKEDAVCPIALTFGIMSGIEDVRGVNSTIDADGIGVMSFIS